MRHLENRLPDEDDEVDVDDDDGGASWVSTGRRRKRRTNRQAIKSRRWAEPYQHEWLWRKCLTEGSAIRSGMRAVCRAYAKEFAYPGDKPQEPFFESAEENMADLSKYSKTLLGPVRLCREIPAASPFYFEPKSKRVFIGPPCTKMSGFRIFFLEHREESQRQLEYERGADYMKQMNRLWRSMARQDRLPYEQKSRLLRMRVQRWERSLTLPERVSFWTQTYTERFGKRKFGGIEAFRLPRKPRKILEIFAVEHPGEKRSHYTRENFDRLPIRERRRLRKLVEDEKDEYAAKVYAMVKKERAQRESTAERIEFYVSAVDELITMMNRMGLDEAGLEEDMRRLSIESAEDDNEDGCED